MSKDLPDIQHTEKPAVPFYINQVGIQNVRAPFILDSRYGGKHEMIANITMTTDLEKDIKGISMSKLIRTLREYLDRPLKNDLIKEILEKLRVEVETNSNNSTMRFDFQLPVHKKSPKSAHVFPEYYDCSFEGNLVGNEYRFFERAKIQYSSYCPCSGALCMDLSEKGMSGYPHAQRCFADVTIEVNLPSVVWLEDIIEIVEKEVITIPYPVIQRVDEQEIARLASTNPMFVEDAIRKISSSLNSVDRIKDWIVKCVHEESIHTHEAIAINWKGVTGGFTGSIHM